MQDDSITDMCYCFLKTCATAECSQIEFCLHLSQQFLDPTPGEARPPTASKGEPLVTDEARSLQGKWLPCQLTSVSKHVNLSHKQHYSKHMKCVLQTLQTPNDINIKSLNLVQPVSCLQDLSNNVTYIHQDELTFT